MKLVVNMFSRKNITFTAMLLSGAVILAGGLAGVSFAQDNRIEEAASLILTDLIEGSFGALVMIVAGLVAIVAAAMGAYRAAISALVVAVGAFILRTFVTIFFPDVGL
jgi:hypothetical protein